MRKVLAFAVVATATLGIGFAGTTVKAAEPAQNIDISKMKVNWSDEFNGTELNSDHWTPEIGNGNWGWGNNEKEYYRANNISVSDGTMKIKAQTEKVGSYNWTSGRIKSAGKVNIGYGYVEARIKIPSSQGIWRHSGCLELTERLGLHVVRLILWKLSTQDQISRAQSIIQNGMEQISMFTLTVI